MQGMQAQGRRLRLRHRVLQQVHVLYVFLRGVTVSRFKVGSLALVVAGVVGAAGCGSDDDSGGGSGGASGTGATGAGGGSAGTSTGGASGAAGSSSGGGAGASSGGASGSGGSSSDAGSDSGADSGTCLTGTKLLATVPPGGGSKCSFTFSGSYTPGAVNLLLTPGWGTVCFAGSSSGCGSGASADGWWFVGPNEIALCDATCNRFYKQPAGKLTLRFGCASESCNH